MSLIVNFVTGLYLIAAILQIGVVTFLEGEVYIYRNKVMHKVKEGDKIFENDKLVIKEDSQATVLLENGDVLPLEGEMEFSFNSEKKGSQPPCSETKIGKLSENLCDTFTGLFSNKKIEEIGGVRAELLTLNTAWTVDVVEEKEKESEIPVKSDLIEKKLIEGAERRLPKGKLKVQEPMRIGKPIPVKSVPGKPESESSLLDKIVKQARKKKKVKKVKEVLFYNNYYSVWPEFIFEFSKALKEKIYISIYDKRGKIFSSVLRTNKFSYPLFRPPFCRGKLYMLQIKANNLLKRYYFKIAADSMIKLIKSELAKISKLKNRKHDPTYYIIESIIFLKNGMFVSAYKSLQKALKIKKLKFIKKRLKEIKHKITIKF